MSNSRLINLSPCGHENYFLWLEDPQEFSLNIKVTDGYKLWENSVEAGTNKPKSRKESDSEYIKLILDCLQDIDSDKRDYGINITASGCLQFVIKEKLGKMMALLLKIDMTENFDATSGIRAIFAGICESGAVAVNALESAYKEIRLNREANDSLTKTIEDYTKDKESFQNDFFKNMCLVLNTKKREIIRLQQEVTDLQNEISSINAKNTKTETTKASKAQAKKKSGKNTTRKNKKNDDSDNESEIQSQSTENDDSNDSDNSENDPDSPRRSRKRKQRHPPSYSQKSTTRLKKKSSQSSQVMSQVLAPSSSSTETTSQDLSSMLSQSNDTQPPAGKRKRRQVVESQDQDEDGVNVNYTYDDDSGSGEDCQVENSNSQSAKEDIPADSTSTQPKKKTKKNAFDKYYDSDSSDENNDLMDYL